MDLAEINKNMVIIYKDKLYEEVNLANPIEGGVGDNFKKYDKKEMKKGLEVEKEHIGKNNKLSEKVKKSIEMDIAKDHLKEIPDYYTRLDKMEKSAEK